MYIGNLAYDPISDKSQYSFKGTIDTGLAIEGELIGAFGEYTPTKIIIGNSNINEGKNGKFYLIHLCLKKSIQFEYKGFEINISPLQNNEDACNYLLKSWENTEVETAVLHIHSKTDTAFKTILNLAIDICDLLSIVSGEMIIFNRQEYQFEQQIKEIWRRRVKEPDSGNQILKSHNYREFLEITLPNYQKLDNEKRGALKDAINYINTIQNGFVEDRVMRICQAWEGLADKFLSSEDHKKELPKELQDLRMKIDNAYDCWKQNHTDYDKDGKIKGKILNPISQITTQERLKRLANQFNFKNQEVGLNFQKLIGLRNNRIAHIGRMKNASGKNAVKQILIPAVQGIQILLLKILKYDGRVLVEENGWKSPKKVDTFFDK